MTAQPLDTVESIKARLTGGMMLTGEAVEWQEGDGVWQLEEVLACNTHVGGNVCTVRALSNI